MITQAAFDSPGTWYRGNLHTHSKVSDGELTPNEAVEYYQQHGYDFVALTDHMVFANVSDLSQRSDFLVLPGIEVHGDDPESRIYHIVGLGGSFAAGERLESGHSFVADVQRLLEHDCLVHFAHPYWSGQLSHQMLPVDGAYALEVYNGVTDIGYAKGFSKETWDALLAAGRRISAVAVDDAHWAPWRPDAGLGWVMVNAEELTAPAILSALREGRFYSTTGPAIHDVRVEGDEVVISSSPAVSISAIGERWFCNTVRSTTGLGMTQAKMKLWEGQTYVRAEVVDRYGKTAWSNPIYLV